MGIKTGHLPISLKLNKKGAYVNTKSGGVKSFFTQYFPQIKPKIQQDFNHFIDLEFQRMAHELHDLHDLDFTGNFQSWVSKGLSELPGELDPESRAILKAYYARIAGEIHRILQQALMDDKENFLKSLPHLLGLGREDMLQVIYYHHFPRNNHPDVKIHSLDELKKEIFKLRMINFGMISSVEFEIGKWSLQIRVKPMNKFTTTAIKINCSMKFRDDL